MITFNPPHWRTPSPVVRGVSAVAASVAAMVAVGAIHILATHYAVRTELAVATAPHVHATATLPCRGGPAPALTARPS